MPQKAPTDDPGLQVGDAPELTDRTAPADPGLAAHIGTYALVELDEVRAAPPPGRSNT
jgi:hypothetical protein